MSRLENEVKQVMAVIDAESGKVIKYWQLMTHPKNKVQCSRSAANKFGRLANGVGGRIKSPTKTIRFIRKSQVPKGRMKDVTYRQYVCSVRPEKEEKYRARYVVGSNKIIYPGEVATPTVNMRVAKFLFNSVISAKGARFITIDISNFYLMMPLKRPEYIRINLRDLPEETIKECGLKEKATTDGAVYIKSNCGMYGLPQSGLLANQLLGKRLNKHMYQQSKLVPGLWNHDWRLVQFTLVVETLELSMREKNTPFIWKGQPKRTTT